MTKTIITLVLLLLLPVDICQAQAATTGPAPTELVFAYFPMAVPVAPLGEVMRRDLILQQNLAKQGFKINFLTLAKGKDAVELIRQQKLDGVSFSDLPTVETITTGDMQVLGFVKQSFSAVVAPSATQVKDLRKKRIGTVPGSTSHYALLHALQAAGIKEQEVTLVAMEAIDLIDALATGKVDAVAGWEPTPTAILSKYPGRFSLIHRQISYSYFLLSPELLHRQPAVAREISAALLRAIRWLKKSETNLIMASNWTLASMAKLTGKTPQLTAGEIAQLTINDLLSVPGAPLLRATEGDANSPLARLFHFMKNQGQLPATADWNRARDNINHTLLKEISGQPTKYRLQTFSYVP